MGPFGTTTPGSSSSGGDFSPSQMAGAQSPSPDPESEGFPNPDSSPEGQGNALSAVVEQVRGMETQLQSLAQQFPAVAPEVRRAVESVRSVLKRIVSSPGEAEPAAPRSFA